MFMSFEKLIQNNNIFITGFSSPTTNSHACLIIITLLIQANNLMWNYAVFALMWMMMLDLETVIRVYLDRIDQLEVIRNRPSFLVGFSVHVDLMVVVMNRHKPSFSNQPFFLLWPMMINLEDQFRKLDFTIKSYSYFIKRFNSLNTTAANLQRLIKRNNIELWTKLSDNNSFHFFLFHFCFLFYSFIRQIEGVITAYIDFK